MVGRYTKRIVFTSKSITIRYDDMAFPEKCCSNATVDSRVDILKKLNYHKRENEIGMDTYHPIYKLHYENSNFNIWKHGVSIFAVIVQHYTCDALSFMFWLYELLRILVYIEMMGI